MKRGYFVFGILYGKNAENVDFADLGTIVNSIVIEAICLYLSGALDKMKTEDDSHDDLSEN